MHNPSEEGITHINVYSKGQTALGRWLSNFAHEPIELAVSGKFASIEGYWYWVTRQDDRLRRLSGFAAKQLGRTLPNRRSPPDAVFRALIRQAIFTKADKRPDMIAELRATNLPLAHYYVFNGVPRDAGYEWILDIWQDIRNA